MIRSCNEYPEEHALPTARLANIHRPRSVYRQQAVAHVSILDASTTYLAVRTTSIVSSPRTYAIHYPQPPPHSSNQPFR